MPCKNISDVLTILLDENEKVIDYSLHKRSCGREIGKKKMIKKWLAGRKASDIIAIGPEQFEQEIRPKNEKNCYLAMKHFLAVQNGLAVLLGRISGSVDDNCTVEYIDYSQNGIEMVAHLKINAPVKNIQSCKAYSTSKEE